VWVSESRNDDGDDVPPPSFQYLNSLAVVLVLNTHQKWAWSSGGKTTPRCYSTGILKGTPRDWLTPGPWRKTDNNGQVGQCVWGAVCRRFAVGKGGILKCRDRIWHFGWWYCICCIPGKVNVDRYVGNIGRISHLTCVDDVCLDRLFRLVSWMFSCAVRCCLFAGSTLGNTSRNAVLERGMYFYSARSILRPRYLSGAIGKGSVFEVSPLPHVIHRHTGKSRAIILCFISV
jgi:hypothetical protein